MEHPVDNEVDSDGQQGNSAGRQQWRNVAEGMSVALSRTMDWSSPALVDTGICFKYFSIVRKLR